MNKTEKILQVAITATQFINGELERFDLSECDLIYVVESIAAADASNRQLGFTDIAIESPTS